MASKIVFENNMKGKSPCKVDHLPVKINKDGATDKIDEYFRDTAVNKNGSRSTTLLRGRVLEGEKITLPKTMSGCL